MPSIMYSDDFEIVAGDDAGKMRVKFRNFILSM